MSAENKSPFVARAARFSIACLAVPFVAAAACVDDFDRSRAVEDLRFAVAAREFVAAFETRDRTAVAGFLDPKNDFHAELPGGRTCGSVDEFLASQAPWFEGLPGRLAFTVRRVFAAGDSGLLDLDGVFEESDGSGRGSRVEAAFHLGFHRRDGRWVLVDLVGTTTRETAL